MAKYKYERLYYLIGPYDTIYGRFSKLREAKAHMLDMARNGARLHVLKPGIYKSCDQPIDEYSRTEVKYIEDDQCWAFLYFSWQDYVEEVLKTTH